MQKFYALRAEFLKYFCLEFLQKPLVFDNFLSFASMVLYFMLTFLHVFIKNVESNHCRTGMQYFEAIHQYI